MIGGMRRSAAIVACVIVVALLAGASVFLLRYLRSHGSARPAAVEKKEAPATAVFSGKIVAQHTVTVSATVNGEIGAFLVDAGQDVYEGQLLARIVNPELESSRENAAGIVEKAQAKVNAIESAIIAARLEASRAITDATRAKDQFERTEKLYKRQAMLHGEGATPRQIYEKSQREFESAKGEYQSVDTTARQSEERVANLRQELDSAKKALEEKNKQLEDMQSDLAAAEVHSPVTGVVVARHGEAGKMLSPEDAGELFQIAVDLSQLQAVFEPDAATLQRIRPGQAAFVTVPDLQSDALPAAIKESKGAEVIAELISPNASIRPGMNCSVSVPLK